MTRFIGLWALVLVLAMGEAGAAGTLDTVKARGHVVCGVSEGTPGFASPDDKGQWQGLDADMCRSVAAAIFNDPKKVVYRPLSSKDRFTALQSGEIDILSRITTYTISRNTLLGADFVGVLYYDGQGFITPKKSNIKTVADLNGATICVETGTTTELNVADYFKAHGLKYQLLAFQKVDESTRAYESGRCDAYTNDHSSLAAQRLKFKTPGDHVILPDIISKEPLAPAVRSNDFQWSNVVRWSLYALLNAEELGITQANVDQMKSSANPEVRRFLGLDADFGQPMGLSPDWAARIVRHVGNYGESFERNVGAKSPLGLKRGLNALWKDGGVQYPPPIR